MAEAIKATSKERKERRWERKEKEVKGQRPRPPFWLRCEKGQKEPLKGGRWEKWEIIIGFQMLELNYVRTIFGPRQRRRRRRRRQRCRCRWQANYGFKANTRTNFARARASASASAGEMALSLWGRKAQDNLHDENKGLERTSSCPPPGEMAQQGVGPSRHDKLLKHKLKINHGCSSSHTHTHTPTPTPTQHSTHTRLKCTRKFGQMQIKDHAVAKECEGGQDTAI